MTDLKKENDELKKYIEVLEEKIKNYKNPKSKQKYYQEHKKEIIQKSMERQQNIPKEKRQEYAKRYYLKKKNMNLEEK